MGWGPGWPVARAGMRIGLLGGSFDPAHQGHVHLTLEMLKRLQLDRVWWLVSPGNPLKKVGPAPMFRRLDWARAAMRHPRVAVTDLECRLGTRYTADTIASLQTRYPGVRFVWLMGADNMAELHRWDDWREIPSRVPMGIVARPGERLAARLSAGARTFARGRVRADPPTGLAWQDPPAWAFVNLPMRPESSTALRASGNWDDD